MSSLQLTVAQPRVSLREVAESAMGRHVAELGFYGSYLQINADSLFIAARLMPHLRVLYCNLELTPAPGPLLFPSGLRVLNFDLAISVDPAAAAVNAALEAVSRLPLLETLIISLADFDEQFSFAPLARLPLLRHLCLCQQTDFSRGWFPPAVLSDAHVTQIRALPLLRHLDVRPMTTALLRRLLAQPHQLQWQQIALPDPVDDEAVTLLPQLPTLTVLQSFFHCSCERFGFLRLLPNLTNALLAFREPIVAGRIDLLVGELQCCTQVEVLGIGCADLTAAHLADLLPRLPRLRWLSLYQLDIDSLSFLAQPPMTRQLTLLQLADCKRLPLAELRHVHTLQGLTQLDLDRSFVVPMDPLIQSHYTPPSALMPQLRTFSYSPPHVFADENENEVDEDDGEQV